MGLADRILFPGWIANSEKDKMFKSASIFCLPSYAEGLPMAVLDAMAYLIPVISTPVGGILDFFVDGEHALIFEPGDTGTLSFKLRNLIINSDLRSTLSANANLIVEKDFNVTTITEQLNEIYQSLSV